MIAMLHTCRSDSHSKICESIRRWLHENQIITTEKAYVANGKTDANIAQIKLNWSKRGTETLSSKMDYAKTADENTHGIECYQST